MLNLVPGAYRAKYKGRKGPPECGGGVIRRNFIEKATFHLFLAGAYSYCSSRTFESLGMVRHLLA